MSDSTSPEPRPYHHGDLRRALVEAARRLLEAEGPAAMSLRAVAREAGVSPAAPYHHFKDKGELLSAVASEGWAMLSASIAAAASAKLDDTFAPTLAYIAFTREHPALYRIMYDAARDAEALPFIGIGEEGSPYAWVRDVLDHKRMDSTAIDIELEIAASWCATHGVAEMIGFRQFDHLKTLLGGEVPFLKALFEHLHLGAHHRKR